MKKVLCFALVLTLSLSMFTGFAFAETDSSVKTDYTKIDYSNMLLPNESTSWMLFSGDPYVEFEYGEDWYWVGNAVGATAYLVGGKEYTIEFTVSASGDDKLQPDLFVLKDQLTGSSIDDTLVGSYGNVDGIGSCTITRTFTPEGSLLQPFKILAICYMTGDIDKVNYTIKITGDELSDLPTQTYTTCKVSYSKLDYTRKISTDGTAARGRIMTVGKATTGEGFWNGNVADGYAYLEAYHDYEISFKTAYIYSSGAEAEIQPKVAVLKYGTLKGTFSNDVVAEGEGAFEQKGSATSTVSFTPETSGNYRILGACYLNDSFAEYAFTIKDVTPPTVALSLPEIEYEWKSEYTNNNDEGGLAYGPNGEFAVLDYSSEYSASDDEYYYYLSVYYNDGELKFARPMPYGSDATPVFDDEGNVYAATYSFNPELDSDHEIGYVTAYDTNGDQIWEFIYEEDSDDDYDVRRPLYVSGDVLIVCFDSAIVGIEKETGSTIWSIEDLECYRETPLDALTVCDGIIYLALDGTNTVYHNGYDVTLYNPILLIDADTGRILEYVDGFESYTTESTLLVQGDYLYFFTDGTYSIDSDTDNDIYCPFCILDLTNGQISRKDLGFDDGDNFVIAPLGENTVFVSDSKGNAAILLIQEGEVTFGLPVNFEEAIFGDDDTYNALKVGDAIVPRENVKNIYIDYFATDKYENMYFLAEFKANDSKWYDCLLSWTQGVDEDGKPDGDFHFEILPLKEVYGHNIIVTDDYVYVSEGYGYIYGISLAKFAGADDTDTEIETDTEEETDTEIETDTDTDSGDILKGDINNDGIVDILDVVLARAHIVGNKLLSDEEQLRGDMNDDGTLDIIDVVMMRKYIVDKK